MFVVTANAFITIVYGSFYFLIDKKPKKKLIALGYLSSLIELNAIYHLTDFKDPTSSWIGSLMIICVLFAQLLVTVLVMLIHGKKCREEKNQRT